MFLSKLIFRANRRKLCQTVVFLIAIALFSIVVSLTVFNYNNLSLNTNYYLNSIENEKRNPKIFCMITTRYENHESKAIAVKNTWAKRCDKYLFLSSKTNSTLPAIKICGKDDRKHLWCKTKSGFHYVYDNYINQFEWFLKADDDSYVIIENLRHFLSNYSPESPLYFGCKFKHNKVVYMSGGAGYVLSRESLRRFIQQTIFNYTSPELCRAHSHIGAEDYELGKCLQTVGVTAGDSRDDSKKPRFFPFDPLKWVSPNSKLNRLAPWFENYTVYPHQTGADCCSHTLISFHYVPKDLMYLMDFLLYNVNVIK